MMTATSDAVTAHELDLIYFGKLPSRGDFIRSAQHSVLIEQLDQWQSQTMERLSVDPRWKLRYDAAPSVAFAVLGMGSHAALAGHWMASQDTSGRRFPFVAACSLEVRQPESFACIAPLALLNLWSRLASVSKRAHAAADFAEIQSSLQAPQAHDVSEAQSKAKLDEFFEMHSVASLEQMLMANGCKISLRQAILALGMLLQPVSVQGTSRLKKALCLPLTRDGQQAVCLASFWLSLILPFFARHDTELGLYLVAHEQQTSLVIGFAGASSATLSMLIDAHTLAKEAVHLDQSDWVESEIQGDHGLLKLSHYLRDPGLCLTQAVATYQEVFLGI